MFISKSEYRVIQCSTDQNRSVKVDQVFQWTRWTRGPNRTQLHRNVFFKLRVRNLWKRYFSQMFQLWPIFVFLVCFLGGFRVFKIWSFFSHLSQFITNPFKSSKSVQDHYQPIRKNPVLGRDLKKYWWSPFVFFGPNSPNSDHLLLFGGPCFHNFRKSLKLWISEQVLNFLKCTKLMRNTFVVSKLDYDAHQDIFRFIHGSFFTTGNTRYIATIKRYQK